MVRVSFIGGGSTEFAERLVTDLFSFPEFQDITVSLMDIDEERLSQSARVLERYVEDNNLDATIEATTDRRESLRNADYVMTAIHVGGPEPFENEIYIPEEYGVYHSVGDTMGPGGVFRTLRTAPTMIDIARDMEELCPDALLLNYTNPMAMLCWAIDEATEIDVVGLCHSVQGTASNLAEYAGVPENELDYWVAGINHVAWFLELEHEGEDLYPAVHEAMEDPDTYGPDCVRFDMMDHFGYFVTESSPHMSEYVPYFRTEKDHIEEITYSDWTWMPTGYYLENVWSTNRENAVEMDPEEVDTEIERSEEYGTRLIHSIETDEPRRMNLNVRNDTDAIQNLGSDACVEVPCLVDGTGVRPCSVGELPPQLAAIDESNIRVQRLAVEGVLNDDPTAVRRAIKLDPLTSAACTLEEAEAMIDDLFAANAEYLSDDLVAAADF